MIKFLESKLFLFRSCFRREKTFRWLVAAVLALILRPERLGVTSFVRALYLKGNSYETFLHFFKSTAVHNSELRDIWLKIVRFCGLLKKCCGRCILPGDGTRVSKEGKRMPGVKRLHQESEDSSKAEYFFGHMYGAVGAVISGNGNSFCVPLDVTIQDGLAETAAWEGGNSEKAASHVVQTVRSAYHCAETPGDSILVPDRFFLTAPALEELATPNQDRHGTDIVTRAKNNCIACEMPATAGRPRKGRPGKKGEAVKLAALFDARKDDFLQAEVVMYGAKETVEYLCLDLLWGQGLYTELRFVLSKSHRGNAIFVSTDTTSAPEAIIETYAIREKIEVTFREFKQQINGFGYHFRTRSQPKLNRYRKRGAPSELSAVHDGKARRRILETVKATGRFVLCSCVAIGIVQMMALTPSIANKARESRYLRTKPANGKVSEATIVAYVRQHFYRVLLHSPDSFITKIIRGLQMPESDTEMAA